tara:strand:- start:15 stop:638 length:624 start_codon:yes stop_codon:yes gene_type:complete
MMRVLIACEYSGKVRDAFAKKGHFAMSCDLLPSDNPKHGVHYIGDVLDLLSDYNVWNRTNGWDLMIAFPPCTHLAVSGARWFPEKRADGRQQQGIDFFMALANAEIPKIAIENPVGIMSTKWRKPDQIIQPYQFGDSFSKKTCLWLKGLPLLKPTELVDKGEQVKYKSGKSMPKWYADAFQLPPKERAKIRSKTFPGIADAMATQWN